MRCKKNILGVVMMVAILTFLLVSCVTPVPIQVQRPPTMNTSGIQRIAVMDFKATGSGTGDIARYLSSQARSRFGGIAQFTLVNNTTIEQLQRSNQAIDSHVDALFSGEVISAGYNQKSENKEYTNKKTGETTRWTEYTTTVEVVFNYYFTRARDGSMIGPVSRTARMSQTSREGYPPVPAMMQAAVDRQLNTLHQDVAPYTTTVREILAKSKIKANAQPMKDAEAMVKAKSYRPALNMYLKIYNDTYDVAAAINAAILYKALGEYVAGRDLMQAAYAATGNPDTQTRLADFNKLLADQQTIAEDYGDKSSQRAKVVAYAIGEMQRVFPSNARVWIYNQVASDPISEAVVDDFTAEFIRRGIFVADRENAELVAKERNFQLSGEVRDDDFVSIGNAMGVNTIVLVRISGTGALRRLGLRVLDIETQRPILQSDTSQNWEI